MSDPFSSSKSKLARAKEHAADLEKRIEDFVRLNPYEEFVEDDPKRPGFTIRKVRLSKPLPESLSNILGDLVNNLRNALDNAAYDIAVASGKYDPKFTAFPFAGSVHQMANSLGRAKDLPKEIHSLFCGFQPYLGGDDLLWLLNEICVSDKHKTIIPMGVGVVQRAVNVQVTGWFSMPDPHVWDRAKNEMEIITLAPGSKFNYQFHFRIYVAFGNIKLVDGEPIFPILDNLVGKVERILTAMEAESKRLGIVN